MAKKRILTHVHAEPRKAKKAKPSSFSPSPESNNDTIPCERCGQSVSFLAWTSHVKQHEQEDQQVEQNALIPCDYAGCGKMIKIKDYNSHRQSHSRSAALALGDHRHNNDDNNNGDNDLNEEEEEEDDDDDDMLVSSLAIKKTAPLSAKSTSKSKSKSQSKSKSKS